MNTVLRYPGGKSRAIKLLMGYIPGFKEYREPFIGGASIFLAVKEEKGENRKYIINDLYFETYNFWKMIKEKHNDVVNRTKLWREEYKGRGMEMFRFLTMSRSTFSDVEHAASFFILNRSSFSGMGQGISDDAFKNRFTESSIDNLRELGESGIFNGVDIRNLDYQKIVEMESEFNTEDVLVVCDPPYYKVGSAKLYGKDGMLHQYFDHERFARVMKNCKYRWMVTYDDSNKVRKLFESCYVVEYDLVYGMGNTRSINNTSGKVKQGKELLIANFNLEAIKNKNKKQKNIEEAWG
jgi:DNA adenine methylase